MSTSPSKPGPDTKKDIKKDVDNKDGSSSEKIDQDQKGMSNMRGGRGGQRGQGGGRGRGGDRGGRGGGGGDRSRGGFKGRGGFQGGDRKNYSQQGQSGYNNPNQMSATQLDTRLYLQSEEGPKEPKKFTGRCRLFVGNVTADTTDEEFKEMFSKYGETGEMFLNGSKGFGFIRMDFRHNAEAAKAGLDGTVVKGRTLRVRFSNQGSAIKIKNLSPFVSNELLEMAMQQFGEIERAVVVADDRGRSTGEGIVEFSKKPSAQNALKRINEGVFLMSSSPRPIWAETLEAKDEEDGLMEKFLPRNEQMRMDREKEPRFAPPGSFEYRFGLKYREIDDLEKQQMERVKQDMEQQRMKLETEMEGAMFDYQAEQIRADLLRQQEELRRLEEMKTEKMRRRQEFDMRREEEQRMMMEEEERRQMMRGGRSGMDQQTSGSMLRGDTQRAPLPPPPAPPAGMGFDSSADQMSSANLSSSYGSMSADIGAESSMSRFDSNSGGYGGNSQSFGNRASNMGGSSNMQSQGAVFGNNRSMGGQGGMGNRSDRRREGGSMGVPRDDYGDMKRMRRY